MVMLLSRRAYGVSVGALVTSLALPRIASASTAVALSLEQLVARSERVVVGQAVAHDSKWVQVEGSRRIVTTTRFVQSGDWLTDEDAEDELLIATLGGQIGDLHQKVAGEAALRLGEQSVVFVSAERGIQRRVIGMGQGHYPVQAEGKIRRVHRSPSMPHLVGKRIGANGAPRKRRAVDVLNGTTLDEARSLVRSAR